MRIREILLWVALLIWAIVALVVAVDVVPTAFRFVKNRALNREQTRTHDGPLGGRRSPEYVPLLAALPPLSGLGDDSYRFVAMPSFGDHWFAVAIRPEGGLARGLLVTAERDESERPVIASRREFWMPREAYTRLMAEADALSKDWPGDPGNWLDGTVIAFERVSDGEITSGVGNSGTHYASLSGTLHEGSSPYVPSIAHFNGRWDVPRKQRK